MIMGTCCLVSDLLTFAQYTLTLSATGFVGLELELSCGHLRKGYSPVITLWASGLGLEYDCGKDILFPINITTIVHRD